MKRSIILFLIAFLVTAGIGGGVYYAISQGMIPGIQLTPKLVENQQDTTTQPEVTTPTPEPEVPAQPEPPVPTPEPEPEVPAQPEPPVPTPEPEPEVPAQPVAPTPAPEPEPEAPAQPEPTTPSEAEQQEEPAPRITLTPSEQPRSDEHNAVLMAREALRSNDADAAMKLLVNEGGITPQAATDLLAWAKNNKAGELQEIASSRRPDGNKVTRYRLKSENGTEDILLDVVTNENQRATIESATPTPADKTDFTVTNDHITVTEGFMEAVRTGNMNLACTLITGEEVSLATIAGLCMVFEEDNFRMRQNTPIRNTFQNDQFAGNLVYLESTAPVDPANTENAQSPVTRQEAQIPIELTRTESGWRVKMVGMAGLLSTYENQGNEENGRYFPIVKNPKGGDSIALFFAFNESKLTPRSRHQLQIVADLLKQTQRKLNISGHTDDVGSEHYNLQLSERRAEAVKAALVDFGVGAEQITTHGMGKSQPRRMYKEDDSEQTVNYIRGENRRAEIYLDFES